MIKRKIKPKKASRAICPECKKWYARDTMVVVRYGVTAEIEVCADCYEEVYFVPPAPLKKGENNV